MSVETRTWCDTCLQYVCPRCFSLHPCLASKLDFSDSATNSPRGDEHEAVDEPKDRHHGGGARERTINTRFIEIGQNVYVSCEAFEDLSFVHVCTDGIRWHSFGATIADFQVLCENCPWDIPEGLVVLHSDIGKALVFQSGRLASAIAPWSAIHYMRARRSMGIIMRRATIGDWSYFYLVEVHRYRGW